MTINPVFGQLFGGKLITIAGPCYEDTPMNIRCKFGGKVVDGFVSQDMTKAFCVSAPQQSLGEYLLELSVDGGATYTYRATYYAGNGLYNLMELILFYSYLRQLHIINTTMFSQSLVMR